MNNLKFRLLLAALLILCCKSTYSQKLEMREYYSDLQIDESIPAKYKSNVVIEYNKSNGLLTIQDKSKEEAFVCQIKYVRTTTDSTDITYWYKIITDPFSGKFNTVKITTWKEPQIVENKIYEKMIVFSKYVGNNRQFIDLGFACNSVSSINIENNRRGIILNGRKLIIPPSDIEIDSEKTGTIVVDISVDKNGNVIKARAGGKGTSLAEISLWNLSEKAALNCKFNAIQNDEIQLGKIVFTLRIQ